MNRRSLIAAVLAGATVAASNWAMAADASKLVVFDWAGYEDPNFYKSYVDKYGGKPTYAFFGDEEEAFQKLRAGFKADLAHPCSQSVVKWNQAGLLEPIDTSKLKYWADINPNFKNMQGFSVDGKQYIVPLDWGATAMTYNTKTVPAADADTLQSFIDPKYKGRVSIGDNVDDAYALAFLATGVKDWTKATDAEFQAASAWLRKAHKNVRTYWQDPSELAQLMASGEVQIAWAWNETAVTLQGENKPIAMKRDTKEGSTTWVCGYVRLKGGSAPDQQVYDFLNAWMSPETAKYIVTEWGYGHSNMKGMAEVDPKTLEASGFGNLDKYTKNTLWQAPVPTKLREKMIAEFEKIKAGF